MSDIVSLNEGKKSPPAENNIFGTERRTHNLQFILGNEVYEFFLKVFRKCVNNSNRVLEIQRLFPKIFLFR